MADRTPGAMAPPTWRGMLTTIAERFGLLERRVSALESRSGQTLPPDFRFTVNEAGQLVIERVSTGATYVVDV